MSWSREIQVELLERDKQHAVGRAWALAYRHDPAGPRELSVAQLRELARRQQLVSSQAIAQQLERVPAERETYRAVVRHDLASLRGRRQHGRLQADLDTWLAYYNGERTHQGKMCCGRTPLQTLIAGKEVWREKVSHLNLI